jgi:hypothetical protein
MIICPNTVKSAFRSVGLAGCPPSDNPVSQALSCPGGSYLRFARDSGLGSPDCTICEPSDSSFAGQSAPGQNETDRTVECSVFAMHPGGGMADQVDLSVRHLVAERTGTQRNAKHLILLALFSVSHASSSGKIGQQFAKTN